MANRQLADTYRPAMLDHVVGQDHAIKQIKGMLKQKAMPNTILIIGKSGCGKTTLARIIGLTIAQKTNDKLPKLMARTSPDFHEYSLGNERGIEKIREIVDTANYMPQGKYAVFAIDEIAKITPQAFSPLLKTLEEPPKHSVFILITDEPQKLPLTILNRCYKITLNPLDKKSIRTIVERVAKNEEIRFNNPKIIKHIVRQAPEARTALQMLQQARDASANTKNYKDIIRAIEAAPDGLDNLAVQCLIYLYRKKHIKVMSIILDVNDIIGFVQSMLTYNKWCMDNLVNKVAWSNENTSLFKKYLKEPPSLDKLSHVHNVLINLRTGFVNITTFEQKHLLIARLASLTLML